MNPAFNFQGAKAVADTTEAGSPGVEDEKQIDDNESVDAEPCSSASDVGQDELSNMQRDSMIVNNPPGFLP